MRRHISLLICIHIAVSLRAQESVRFDSVRIYGGFLGYETSKCQDKVLDKDFGKFKMRKGILEGYFKRRSIGDNHGASRLIKKDSELRKLVGDGDNFTTVATVYFKFGEKELGLTCNPRIEGYIKKDSVLFDRNYLAPKMSYFFSSEESFKKLVANNLFVKEQAVKDSLQVYSGSGFKAVIIPPGIYNIEARFIGDLVPYYCKAFELIAIKPAD
jgi:hypothetical protein